MEAAHLNTVRADADDEMRRPPAVVDARPPVYEADAGQGRLAQFADLVWSPCACPERASRWFVLDPLQPLVIDSTTGQQVCLQDEGSASVARMQAAAHSRNFDAAWLKHDGCLVLYQYRTCLEQASKPGLICLVNADSQRMHTIALKGGEHARRIACLTVRTGRSPTEDMVYLVAGADDGLAEHLNVYALPSCQLLHDLACPQPLLDRFNALMSHSPHQPGAGRAEGEGWSIMVKKLQLSPSKELLAVVWELAFLVVDSHLGFQRQVQGSQSVGISIHPATVGAHLCSLVLGTAESVSEIQPAWLPCSLNLIYLDSNRSLHLVTSLGQQLWSVPLSCRGTGLLVAQASEGPVRRGRTSLDPSPCGRWILVTDEADRDEAQASVHDRHTVQHNIVEAATGGFLHRQLGEYRSALEMRSSWSSSGDVCLLHGLFHVLIAHPGARDGLHVFQMLQLMQPGHFSHLPFSGKGSLSPSGSIVIGSGPSDEYWDFGGDGLLHWQLPTALPAQDAAAQQDLHPAVVKLSISEPDIYHLAWHPLECANVYAIGDARGGVHVIDAKGNKCVRSWTDDELHCHFTQSQQDHHSICRDQSTFVTGTLDGDGYGAGWFPNFDYVLRWSRDGYRLAVASRGRCSILHFLKDFDYS